MRFENPQARPVIETYFELGENLLLIGPSGTGKTMVIREMCGIHNLHMERITGKEGLDDLSMLGAYVSTETAGKYQWVDGPLSRAFRQASQGVPTLLLVDEINRMPSRHQNIFIEAINIYDDGMYVLDNPLRGETLKAPMDLLRFAATANTGQAGLHEIPQALLDRFNLVYVGYPPPNVERKIVAKVGAPVHIAATLTEFAENTREQAEKMELAAGISTRSLVRVARQFMALGGHDKAPNEQRRIMESLLASPILQCVGVQEFPDWQEKGKALMETFRIVFDNHLPEAARSAGTGRSRSRSSSRRSSGRRGTGAAPLSI